MSMRIPTLFQAAACLVMSASAPMAGPCDRFPLDIELVKQAAQGGDAYCQAVLSLEFYRGTSGKEDKAKSDALAAELFGSNEPLAVYLVAGLYLSGSSSQKITKDEERSKRMHKEFVAKINPETTTDPNYLIALGFVRRFGRDGATADYRLACSYIQRAAELGHPHGMYQFSACIADGHIESATQQDENTWLVRASNLGHPRAAWSYGEINHASGQLKEALEYYELAVDNGDPKFAVRLGWIHEAGLLQNPDWHKAQEYYRLASERGKSNASYRLGWIYLTGFDDFKADVDAAITAFETARDQGDPRAARVLSTIAD